MALSTLSTNLVIHHGITDILSQATEFIHILSAVQEPCDPASLFQWGEVLKDLLQFPSRPCVSVTPNLGEYGVTV